MEPSAIEIRLRRADELRALWLDGFADGGLFIPGNFDLPAGASVLVRIFTDFPSPASTLLAGTVIWRRMPQREDPRVRASSITLRPGIGVAFSVSMRQRVLFLERLGRGTASDGRATVRYPTQLAGELSVRPGERPLDAHVVDVGVRGARVSLAHSAFLEAGSSVDLFVAAPRSGEAALSSLRGRVAWLDGAKVALGLRLDLGTKEERLHWAKIVTRARESLEDHPVKVDRLVG